VRIVGTPAEEGGGGKVKLIDAGAYEGVDVCLMSHPMSGVPIPKKYEHIHGLAYGTSIASSKFRATFTGKPAHAAAAPQEGINALDAAVLAYNGVSMLRQQILPSQRIGGVILEGGEKPNVITSRAVMEYNVRSADRKTNEVLQERVEKCFEGAALATGCSVEFEQYVSEPWK
jgi:amidohydrolase